MVISFLAVFFLTPGVNATTQDWMTRPGTIAHAMSQPDGTSVSLDSVKIDKIKPYDFPGYFVVGESFARNDHIVIAATPSELLRLGQLVDISGTMTTLSNGYRAITNAQVQGYTDRDGNLLYHGPMIKGLLEPTPWQWKADLTVASNVESKASSSGMATLSDYPSPPGPDPSPLAPPTFYTSITALKDALSQGTIANGASVQLECKRITSIDSAYAFFTIGDDIAPLDTLKVCYKSDDNYSAYSFTTNDRINRISGQFWSNGDPNATPPVPATEWWICVNDGSSFDNQSYIGSVQTATQDTIAWAKTFADGMTLTSSLTGKIVSRTFPSQGYFYIQEPLRGSGIRISNTSASRTVQPGSTVTIAGTISSQDGERVITASSVTTTGTATAPKPIGLTNKALGGGWFNAYTPGITDSSGMNNTGLFIRAWGKVTSVGSNFFYLNDGSNIDNGTGNPYGVKVSWAWQGSQDGNPPIAAPEVGWFVCVNGISSSEVVSNQTVRVLRLRKQNDLQVVTPSDNSNPYVDMTNPPDGEIHKAPSQSTVQLSGTATDSDTGIAYVQVGFTATGSQTAPTTWYTANYDRTTHIWTYEWLNPTSKKIWVKATDFAICESTPPVSRDVTVSTANIVKYVKQGCSGTGSSWADAAGTITAAMTAGNSEIWVATGTYLERVVVTKYTSIYGGFSGNETYREQRNWVANPTVIDGSGATAGSAVTVDYNMPNYSFTFDGFMVCNNNGSAINCAKDSVTITISHNNITGNIAGDTVTAGISCAGTASYKIYNNRIWNNKGHGISFSATGGTKNIYNNTVVGNSGVGIYCVGASSPNIKNNIVAYNGKGIQKETGVPAVSKNDVYSNPNPSTNQDYVGFSPTPPSGNISADPVLVDTELHIQATSPCCNAGDDSAFPTSGPDSIDIDRQPRLQGSYIDIGADESDGTVGPSVVIVRVASTGCDTNSGSSWSLAKRNVQAAINAIAALGAGSGEVWVASGTYTGNLSIKSNIGVYGGFFGTETSKNQRNRINNICVLDAQNNGSVVSISTDCTNCTLDGFTVRGGSGQGPSYNKTGGGIYCASSGTVTIANNTITGNSASIGAGIYTLNSSPQILQNSISGNTGSGGGIYSSGGSPTIIDNSIDTNSGGGILCANSPATISNNLITGNAGSGISCSNSSGEISYNSITGNIATNGSGIYCSISSPTIYKNTIYGNGSFSSRYGSGIYCTGGAPAIKNNTITGNVLYDGSGCGIYSYIASPIIDSNIIAKNLLSSASSMSYAPDDGSATATFDSGVGIYSWGGSPSIINNTIVGNRTTYPPVVPCGAGIYCESATLVANNIIVFNSSGLWLSSSIQFRNNCVFSNQIDYYGGLLNQTGLNGNISADPMFLDTYAGNYHLTLSSPCIDAGLNGITTATIDMDNGLRVCNGDCNGSETIDIGADEVGSCAGESCEYYTLHLEHTPNRQLIGSTTTFVVSVRGRNGAPPPVGTVVHISLDYGVLLSIANYDTPPVAGVITSDKEGYGYTDAQGQMLISLTRSDSGKVTATASVDGTCPDHHTTVSDRAVFYEIMGPSVGTDVLFVLDYSGSMLGHEASYPSDGSVQRLVREICGSMINVRFGAVAWNDQATPNKRSINDFAGLNAVNDFCAWVSQFSANVYSGTSAQVAALNAAAADLEAYSQPGSRRFIVYVTDDGIGTMDMVIRESLVQRLEEVTSPNGGVFISLWESNAGILNSYYSKYFTLNPLYPSLAVYGDFDPTNYPNTSPSNQRYLFTLLKARILQQ